MIKELIINNYLCHQKWQIGYILRLFYDYSAVSPYFFVKYCSLMVYSKCENHFGSSLGEMSSYNFAAMSSYLLQGVAPN